MPEEAPSYIAMSDECIKTIRAIDRKLQGRILEAISYLSRKRTEPKGDTVKPLTGDLKGCGATGLETIALCTDQRKRTGRWSL